MQAAAGATLREANGWQREAGGVGVYGNAYMRRALAAQAQPGASLPEDLATLLLAADGRGEAVDGSRRYHLRFASGQLPPALLVAGGLRRPGPAGAQRAEPPGARQPRPAAQRGRLAGPGPRPRSARARAAVQLAAAAGLRTRALLLRVYQPGPALLDGLWTPPLLLLEAPSEATAEVALPPPSPATDADPTAAPSAAAAAAPIARPGRHGVLARRLRPRAGRSPCRATDWRGDPRAGRHSRPPARARPPPHPPKKRQRRARASRYHIHFSNQERPTWTTPSATNCR